MAKPESHRKQHVIIILLPVCCLFLSLLGSVTIFVAMKNERQTYGRSVVMMNDEDDDRIGAAMGAHIGMIMSF